MAASLVGNAPWVKPWLLAALEAFRSHELPANGIDETRRSADPGVNPRALKPLMQPFGLQSSSRAAAAEQH